MIIISSLLVNSFRLRETLSKEFFDKYHLNYDYPTFFYYFLIILSFEKGQPQNSNLYARYTVKNRRARYDMFNMIAPSIFF